MRLWTWLKEQVVVEDPHPEHKRKMARRSKEESIGEAVRTRMSVPTGSIDTGPGVTSS
jgi:hypothetical protein